MNCGINFNYKIKNRFFYLITIKYRDQQMSHLTSRHYIALQHQLSDQTLASHPVMLGRILYFALPYLFAAVINIALFTKILKIHQDNFVKTFPSNPYVAVVFIISIIGVGVAGFYAILNDAWTVKEWILFAVISIFIGFKPLILSAETHATLLIAIFVSIILAISNEWFFILLRDMPEATQNELGWRHFTRNIVGFVQAALIIYTFQNISQSLVHVFGVFQKIANYLFWIIAPIVTILVLVWNIISFGPFLDLIGYIVAALLLFLGAAVSTLFHKVVDYRQSSRQNSHRQSKQNSPRK